MERSPENPIKNTIGIIIIEDKIKLSLRILLLLAAKTLANFLDGINL